MAQRPQPKSPEFQTNIRIAFNRQDFFAASSLVEEYITQYGFDDWIRSMIKVTSKTVSKMVDEKLPSEWGFWNFDPRDYISELPSSVYPCSPAAAADFEAFQKDLDAVLDSGPLIYPTATSLNLAAATKLQKLQIAAGQTAKKENEAQKLQSTTTKDSFHTKRKRSEPDEASRAHKRQCQDDYRGAGVRANVISSPGSLAPANRQLSKPGHNSYVYQSTLPSQNRKPDATGGLATTPKSIDLTASTHDSIRIPQNMGEVESHALQQLAARIRRQINEWEDRRDEAGKAMEKKKDAGHKRCDEERIFRRQMRDRCNNHEKKFAKVQAELAKRGQAVTGDSDTQFN